MRTPKSFGDKLSSLTESNFFMGGGVGVALASYAFLISNASRFGLLLLVIAWLIISISIYRHRFFANKPRRAQEYWNGLVCTVVGVFLAVTWMALIPRTPRPPGSFVRITKFGLVLKPEDDLLWLSEGPVIRFELGKPIYVNFGIKNQGSVAAQNLHYFRVAGFVRREPGTEQDREVEELFKPLYQEITNTYEQGRKGSEEEPDQPSFFSATVVPSKANIDEFYADKTALCAIARIEYDNTQWQERCVLVTREMLQNWQDTNSIYWMFCGPHNASGAHRSGSLL
ncbi:MAG TPA: hypothetical protein VN956_26885 [Pyrinomonadaceae bacterium]|nr:hypothetical protein [Pyrinomonadaceae bacterium]